MTRLEDKPNSKCRKWRFFASKGSGKNRVQASMRFNGTYTEAAAALVEFDLAFKKKPTKKESRMAFSKLADEWIKSRKGKIAETTRTKDKRSMTTANHVIGDVPICDITPPILSDAYARLSLGESPTGKELSGNYVNQVGTAISMALSYAVERGYLHENPAKSDDLPRIRHIERTPPNASQVSEALSKLDVSNPRAMCAYLCASMGLRKGEALGLRWQDIDGDIAHVRHSLRQPRELAPCKTGAGLRDLPIPKHVHDALIRRRSAIEADWDKLVEAGIKKPLDAATFAEMAICADDDGLVITSESASMWWKRTGRKITGLDCTMHDLRHAYLTAAAVNGVPPRVMQALAGHSSPITTMRIYAHANMDAKQDAVWTIASVLHPKSKPLSA